MSGSIKPWPNSGDLTPSDIEEALRRARDEILEAAARMVETRAALFRAHQSNSDTLLTAKAEEAEDIAVALRALQSAGSRVAARGAD